MRLLAMILSAVSGQAPPQTTLAPIPMQPTSQWSLEYDENSCILSRAFGDGPARIQLAIRTTPFNPETELVVISGQSVASDSAGTGSITLDEAASPLEARYVAALSKTGENHVAVMSLNKITAETIIASTTLRVDFPGRPSRRFSLRGSKGVVTALNGCSDDLMKSWGIDPIAEKSIVTPAVPINAEGDWIRYTDYPDIATRQRRGGATTILWTIETNGKARDCRVIKPSGWVDLDRAACAAIQQRARYKPAMDQNGMPVVSHKARKVSWLIPN